MKGPIAAATLTITDSPRNMRFSSENEDKDAFADPTVIYFHFVLVSNLNVN